MNISLSGRTALICGSTQGIGLAVAKEFAAAGAHCILMARNEERLKAIVKELQENSSHTHGYRVADFSRPDEIKKVMQELVESYAIQILVNNTGGPPPGPIAEAEEAAFLLAFNQHLINNHILVKSLLPAMKTANNGRIINIISTSVKIPLRNMGVSNTIRGAVASWAKTMSFELGEFNITVNNILPGYTATERLNSLIAINAKKRGVPEELIAEEMKSDIPLKRFGDPAETAAVAAFLASPAASYVSGVSIPVDGGRTGAF